MNKPRSPLEAMIDQACGVPESQTIARTLVNNKAEVEALLELTTAAIEWRRDGHSGYQRLINAVDRLIEMGW